jgi:selenocysteine-specific elongation factor
VQSVVESLIQQGKVIGVGQGEQRLLLTGARWKQLSDKIAAILQDYHRRFPTRPGMPRVELSSRLKLGNYTAVVLQGLLARGIIAEEGTAVRLHSHSIQLTNVQQEKLNTFLRSIAQNPYSPPGDLISEPDLLRLLVEQGKVVKVSDGVVFAASAYNDMLARVISHIKTHGKVSLAEVRDMFKTSRKYAQAFLEHLDDEKITRRVGDERVLY